ncbi:MAG TPA: dUTP diphosphatase [Thermodesulfobacteriota bacterium]|nr:dUTP diphosphatase [Thermodesulfobacteriota bacterium]
MRVFPDRDLDLPLPAYLSSGAAGMDLAAALEGELTLTPGEIQLIPTGLALAIPEGFEGQIRPRSGLAWKHGITLINSPGTIDSDYRGEIGLPVINLGPRPYTIRRGERLAQLIIQRVYRADLRETDHLEPTERGQGGFGHSGA